MGFVQAEAKYARKHLDDWMKPQRVRTPLMAQPGKSYIKPEPKGVVLIIAPWNYPMSMVMAPLVGAVAAGNCAIMKPSEITSHTSAALARDHPALSRPRRVRGGRGRHSRDDRAARAARSTTSSTPATSASRAS